MGSLHLQGSAQPLAQGVGALHPLSSIPSGSPLKHPWALALSWAQPSLWLWVWGHCVPWAQPSGVSLCWQLSQASFGPRCGVPHLLGSPHQGLPMQAAFWSTLCPWLWVSHGLSLCPWVQGTPSPGLSCLAPHSTLLSQSRLGTMSCGFSLAPAASFSPKRCILWVQLLSSSCVGGLRQHPLVPSVLVSMSPCVDSPQQYPFPSVFGVSPGLPT